MKTAAEWLERLKYEGQSQVCSLEPKDCREMLAALVGTHTDRRLRRKVWVTFDGDEPTWVEASARMAKMQRLANEEKAIPFVESRPGDVVLSREDVKRAADLLDQALNFATVCDRRMNLSEMDLRALLRGGR